MTKPGYRFDCLAAYTEDGRDRCVVVPSGQELDNFPLSRREPGGVRRLVLRLPVADIEVEHRLR